MFPLLIPLLSLSACGPECGDGTVEVDGECVPMGAECGPGTHNVDGVCLPDADTGTRDTDSETDTDTDADTDSDTDTDPGTDTDTGGSVPDVCVDGSGTYTDLQDAVDDAAVGAVLRVCPGVYGPVYAGNGVDVALVATDGPDFTTIFGGADTAVRVDGGVLLVEGFSIRGTSTRDDGGQAAALHLAEGDLTVRDSRVDANGGDFLLMQFDGTGVYEGIEFVDNEMNPSDGILFYFGGGDVEFVHNLVRDTSGAMLMRAAEVDLSLHNNIFWNVTYNYSTGFQLETNWGGDQEVVNNVFYGITATLSPSTAWYLSGVDFRNNIVVETNASTFANGFSPKYSLFWDNTGSGSDMSGDGVIEADPHFSDADAGDFTLRSGYSPAIDAGDDSPEYHDLDGTRNDMGAYGGPGGDW